MRFNVWTPKDCAGEPFRVWRCNACGMHDVAAFQWYPKRCDCNDGTNIENIGEVDGQLVVWEEDEIYEKNLR